VESSGEARHRRLSTWATYLGEVSIINFIDVNPGERHLGGGGDGESLVHAAQRHAVDLEGTSDEQKARRQLLKENNPLTPETSREEDEDGAWSDGFLELGGLGHAAASERHGDVLRGVEAGGLVLHGSTHETRAHSHNTCTEPAPQCAQVLMRAKPL